MCSHCQHHGFEDFVPGNWQPGFMPGERCNFFYPALLWVSLGPVQIFSGGRGSGCQPGPLLITMVVLASVNKELISCAAGLRAAVRWHYVDYNWCGPDSRSLLTRNLLGHIDFPAICTVVDFLTPGSPQLISSI